MGELLALALIGAIVYALWQMMQGKEVIPLAASRAVKAKIYAYQIPDEAYYELVADELGKGQIRQGLWAKAIAMEQGDETKARARYMKLRVESLRNEAEETLKNLAARQANLNQPVRAGKAVVPCPQCKAALRIDAKKFLRVCCPKCKYNFFIDQRV